MGDEEQRRQYPILDKIGEILPAINANPLILVSTPTGSGKTAIIPLIVVKSFQGAKIMVIEPTIQGVMSAYEHQRIISSDISVGYAADRDIHYNDQTQIVYATAGHAYHRFLDLIKSLKNEAEGIPSGGSSRDDLNPPSPSGGKGKSRNIPKITDFSIIMLDEAHLLTTEIDLIQNLWRYLFLQKLKMPRLILSSATVDPEQFPLLKDPQISHQKIIMTDLTKYYVTHSYLDQDDVAGNRYPNYQETPLTIYQKNALSVAEQLRVAAGPGKGKGQFTSPEDPKVYAQAANYVAIWHKMTPVGGKDHVLIFVPGEPEAEKVIQELNQKNLGNAQILPAFRQLSREEIDKIYKAPPVGSRNIIVATDLVETAATIPGIVLIVDTMRRKRPHKTFADSTRLELEFIPESSAIQRCGRTGRTGPGHCHRLITLEKFRKLPKGNQPELLLIPIHKYIVDIFDAGLSPIDVIPRLREQDLYEIMSLLRQLDIIKKDNTLNENSRFVSASELSVRNSVTLYHWIQQQLPPYVGIVMLGMIEGGPYWWYPRKDPNMSPYDYNQMKKQQRQNDYKSFLGYSDVETLVRLWFVCMSEVGGPTAPENEIWDWCKSHKINSHRFIEALRSIKRIGKDVTDILNVEVQIGRFQFETALDKLKKIMMDSTYQDRIVNLSDPIGRAYSNPKFHIFRYVLDESAVSEMWEYPADKLLAIELRGAHSGPKRMVYNISLSLNISPKPDQPVLQQKQFSFSSISGSRSELGEIGSSVLSSLSVQTPSIHPIFPSSSTLIPLSSNLSISPTGPISSSSSSSSSPPPETSDEFVNIFGRPPGLEIPSAVQPSVTHPSTGQNIEIPEMPATAPILFPLPTIPNSGSQRTSPISLVTPAIQSMTNPITPISSSTIGPVTNYPITLPVGSVSFGNKLAQEAKFF